MQHFRKKREGKKNAINKDHFANPATPKGSAPTSLGSNNLVISPIPRVGSKDWNPKAVAVNGKAHPPMTPRVPTKKGIFI